MNVEKQLSIAAYWIGIVSTVLALFLRGLALLGIFLFPSVPLAGGKIPVSYQTFLEGAILFFVMALAGTAIARLKEQKA